MTSRVVVLAVVAALMVTGVGGDAVDARQPHAGDALQRKVLDDLAEFTTWLEENDAQGYIGEVGIPSDGDGRWLRLARAWLADAERARLWVDVWATGEWWGTDYDYSPWVAPEDDRPVSVARPSGELFSADARRTDLRRGVNVSGGEFGAAGSTEDVTDFSNDNPGTYGRDWHYDGQATFDYLAEQGLDTVRLPFRWERVQPRPGGELDAGEVARLTAAVGRAHQAGLGVVLDVHNFGAYHLAEDGRGVRRPIGSPQVSRADFADLWRRLSTAFADVPGVLAYDLMNEPARMPAADGLPPARLWEAASQDAVDAIRATGDDTLIMVAGYAYSHVGGWAQQHPRAWIDDPLGAVRYTAHHYWRLDYGRSYDTEVADAAATGS
ncbi:glycoside hydrolase family 5 protein [Blastococcus sp. PRF04-17]|uniref:glycoside hydrolase family 5 protein n=1 Tax=Blastococcus sp. PRF04-17 TaxID=2933797 RepID=UPI001FF47D4B|nr:cellulase family glycosylhydrolase [Blastococcus sp. PRF04-17]UOY00204.1 glycoside hydrolase family 5 protein [Blastococcus sp. PRF04-17]